MKTLTLTKTNDKDYDVTINNVSRINIINSTKIGNHLIQLTHEPNQRIYLNLKGISFIDSTGFNTLLKVQRIASLNNIRLIIYNVNEDVLELFELLGLNNEFEIINTTPFFQNLNRAS